MYKTTIITEKLKQGKKSPANESMQMQNPYKKKIYTVIANKCA